jgi:hypothetical protein
VQYARIITTFATRELLASHRLIATSDMTRYILPLLSDDLVERRQYRIEIDLGNGIS